MVDKASRTDNPFFAVANRILETHTKRAEYIRPHNAQGELEWLADKLIELAKTAYFVGEIKAADEINDAAKYWKRYGKKPALFPKEISA